MKWRPINCLLQLRPPWGIIFGSVRFLSKKVTKPKLFFLKKKPNRNRVKPTGFGSVRFFRAKTSSNRFGSVFLVLARFSRFWLGFSVWLGFFLVFCWFRFGSVRFFQFFGYKTETEPNRPVFSKI